MDEPVLWVTPDGLGYTRDPNDFMQAYKAAREDIERMQRVVETQTSAAMQAAQNAKMAAHSYQYAATAVSINLKERTVKAKINRILDQYAPNVWRVSSGGNQWGGPSLDTLVCAWGQFLAIEAKGEGGTLMERQKFTLSEIEKAGGATIVIGPGEEDRLHAMLAVLRARAAVVPETTR